MDIKYVKRYLNQQVKLILKNQDFFQCEILELGETTVLIRDKYGDDIPIDLEAIALIRPMKEVVR